MYNGSSQGRFGGLQTSSASPPRLGPPISSAASGLEHTQALIHIIHHIPLLIEGDKSTGSVMDPPSPVRSPTARLYSAR